VANRRSHKLSVQEQRPRSAAFGKGIADLQIRPGTVRRQDDGRQLRQGGDRRAIADLQGHRRGLDAPGARRDTRAALACDRGGVGLRSRRTGPDHDAGSVGFIRNQRLRSRRRLVLSARISTFARLPRRYAVPLHPDIRQRLLFGIRHVQHHRLAGSRAQKSCWPRISANPRQPSTVSRSKKPILCVARCRRGTRQRFRAH
jgi:hypothetical protein